MVTMCVSRCRAARSLFVIGQPEASAGADPAPCIVVAGAHTEQAGDRMKTILITGATSGFGAATARRFAHEGWRVVATGRRAERLKSLQDELGSDRLAVAAFDIQDAAAMQAALAALPEPFKDDRRADQQRRSWPWAPSQAPQANLDDWLTMIQTNVASLVTMTHQLLPTLIERKGIIVNSVDRRQLLVPWRQRLRRQQGVRDPVLARAALGPARDWCRVTSIEPGMARPSFP